MSGWFVIALICGLVSMGIAHKRKSPTSIWVWFGIGFVFTLLGVVATYFFAGKNR